MYDTLLFLHLLAALAVGATVVVYTALALGLTGDPRIRAVGDVLWAVGGLGTLGLGVWLALYMDGYEIWDGWILGAIVLWAVATELGRRAQVGYAEVADPALAPRAPAIAGDARLMHWLRTLAVIGLLVVMVYKPGA